MAIAELVLFAVGFATAVAGRAIIQVRRTGDSGFRGARTRGGWVSGTIVLASVLTIAAPIADLAGLRRVVDAPLVGGIGVALAVLGLAAIFAAQLSMGDSWRVGVAEEERTALVTTGPFTIVRNPIYTACFVAVMGFTLMVPNVLSLVSLAWFVAAFELQVRVIEEPHLKRIHGDAYLRYATTAGRFVPLVGRLPATPRSS